MVVCILNGEKKSVSVQKISTTKSKKSEKHSIIEVGFAKAETWTKRLIMMRSHHIKWFWKRYVLTAVDFRNYNGCKGLVRIILFGNLNRKFQKFFPWQGDMRLFARALGSFTNAPHVFRIHWHCGCTQRRLIGLRPRRLFRSRGCVDLGARGWGFRLRSAPSFLRLWIEHGGLFKYAAASETRFVETWEGGRAMWRDRNLLKYLGKILLITLPGLADLQNKKWLDFD